MEYSESHAYAEHDGAYTFEHTLAWIFAMVALALGAIGLLVGFGIIGGSEAGVNIDEATGPGARGASDWMQGALWLLPAISAALLSRALHGADHHERRFTAEANDGYFATEHAGAYIAAVLAIAAGVLSPLVGFDVFDNGNVAQDGIMWGIASIVPSVISDALHAVRHHQHVAEVVTERRTDVTRGTIARQGR